MALASRTIVHRCNNFALANRWLFCGRTYQVLFNASTRRIHFSHNTANAPNSIPVPPPPTWSISELRLISGEDETDKLSEEELATLARRCLIDVRRLSPERREQLRIDVAGIMRCASVLLDVKDLDVEYDGSTTEALTEEDIYDAPRGLTKIPIRRDERIDHDSGDAQSDTDAHTWNDDGESRAVLQSDSVRKKMIEVGGGKFFSVVTKREGDQWRNKFSNDDKSANMPRL